MGIGSSLSGITFSGLSSGIDSDGIIRRLIALESLPIQRMQAQQLRLQGKQGIYLQFKSRLTSLATSAGALNSESSFNPIATASSNTAVATISASSSAEIGTHQLEVSKLAQGHRISSSAQASASAALNLSGQFVVNGKVVEVGASDSLAAIAQKINSADTDAQASVIDGGAGQAYLTISSAKSGTSGKVQVADLTGTIASSLGLVSGGTAVREAITNGAASYQFSSRSTVVATMMGATGLPAATITINGVDVALDYSTDSLDTIAAKINAAPGINATASVRTIEVNGVSTYKLDIVGAGSTPTFTDENNYLTSIGILQQGYGTELVLAQNAEYKLDGISLTSETNSVTGVVAGATITLLKANATTPETTTLTLTRDDEDIKKRVRALKDAYNDIVDFIKQNSAFDKETFDSGALFGDPVAQQIEATIADLIMQPVEGITGDYTNLTQLGFGFDDDGKLTIDESKLSEVLAKAPDSVGALFRAKGTSSASALEYISSTPKTRPSGTLAYEVNITQLATKGLLTAAVGQTNANPANETLTFGGSVLGSSTYQLVLPTGSTQADTVALINSDSKLKDLVVASVDAGKLIITAKKFGTSGNFTVESNLAAAIDNSGIGTIGESSFVTGVDIAGTINGEAATGNGQFLTGNIGNAKTEGLQIQYSGTVIGMVGAITFTKGAASQINDQVGNFTDSVSGLLTTTDQSIQAQIDSITQNITSLEERLVRREQLLRRQFSAMENAIAQIQAQGSRLSALSVNLNSR